MLVTAISILTAPLAVAAPEDIQLKLIASGAMPKLGGYMPQQATLSAEKPTQAKKLPAVSNAKYALLPIGNGKETVLLMVDEPASGDAKLYVDTNRNGDLTDDPKIEWPLVDRGKDGVKNRMWGAASAKVNVKVGGKMQPVALGVYRFHPEDRAALADKILYYRDYALEGDVSLGGKKYKVWISDDYARGNFTPVPGQRGSGIQMAIDVNANGRIDPVGEAYDVAKPFNIGGTTYEIKGLSADGSKMQIVKSEQTVAEILPPPDLSPGKKALEFKQTSLDGKEISFPGSYKGKIVMIDFWATWCGPCIEELPNLIDAYGKYHDKGFEVLGISFDQADQTDKVKQFVADRKMSWSHLYEGKFWSTNVGTMYGIYSIPAAYLVDGDTGEILATSARLRGPNLAPTIEAALKKKFGN